METPAVPEIWAPEANSELFICIFSRWDGAVQALTLKGSHLKNMKNSCQVKASKVILSVVDDLPALNICRISLFPLSLTKTIKNNYEHCPWEENFL